MSRSGLLPFNACSSRGALTNVPSVSRQRLSRSAIHPTRMLEDRQGKSFPRPAEPTFGENPRDGAFRLLRIDTRHFAVPTEKLFSADAEALNKAFEQLAPPLAARAPSRRLRSGEGQRSRHRCCIRVHVHGVFVSRGFKPPGGASWAPARRVSQRHDWPGLRRGYTDHARCFRAFLRRHPNATVATVAVEICSAAFYLDNDTGVIVSACLFGDGASAALWRGSSSDRHWRASNFRSLHRPEEREKIRFVNAGGRLKNQLHRAVPEVAAEAVRDLFSLCNAKPDQIIAHGWWSRRH